MPKYKLTSYVLTKGINLATHGAILRRWLGSLCSLHPAFAAFETFTPQKIAIFEKNIFFVGDRMEPLQFHDWIRCRFRAGPVTSFRQLERIL